VPINPPTDLEITADRTRIDLDLVHRELAANYWSPGVPRAVVEAASTGSDCWSAHRAGQQVGFARLVTDRATFGWLADVFVVAEARGAGIGTVLVAAVVERAQQPRPPLLLGLPGVRLGLRAPPGATAGLRGRAAGPGPGAHRTVRPAVLCRGAVTARPNAVHLDGADPCSPPAAASAARSCNRALISSGV
jgi:GNAT superfamily N-acetyltransferase